MFKTFEVDGKEYKVRLTAKNAMQLEEKMGKHPLSVLMSLEDNTLPSTKDIVLILFYGLESLQHSLKIEDVYEIYDKMVDNGFDYGAILNVIIDVFKSGGFIPEEVNESEAKN